MNESSRISDPEPILSNREQTRFLSPPDDVIRFPIEPDRVRERSTPPNMKGLRKPLSRAGRSEAGIETALDGQE